MLENIYFILTFALVSLPAPVLCQMTITAMQCLNPEAIEVKCYNEQTNEIAEGDSFRRHEKLLVKVTQIEGACTFSLADFSVLFVPPSALDDSKETVATGKIFNSNDFEIDPYTIENIGKVSLKVFPITMTSSDLQDLIVAADPKTCELNVVYATPEVTLQGGAEAFYPVNEETIIETRIKNLNNQDNSQSGLTLKWKCLVIKGTASGFCNRAVMDTLNNQNNLVIPSKAAKQENEFSITLEVAIRDAPTYASSATQHVFYSSKVAKLEIHCIKNCIPKSRTTLPTMSVILKAICTDCNLSGKTYLFWTIIDSQKVESIDYSRLKNQKGSEFYLQAGSLQDNVKYIVKVQVMGGSGKGQSAELNLHTKLPPPVKDCTIVPTKGKAFETGFQIKCAYFPTDITSKIFAVKDGKTTLMGKTKLLQEELFMLPAGVSVLLNVTDDKTGYINSVNLNVEVTECLDLGTKNSDSEISEAVEDKLREALTMANVDPKLALQGIAAIVSEYSNLPPDKQGVTKALDNQAIAIIKKIKLDSAEGAQQVVDILGQIADRYGTADPYISAQSTDICIKASNILLNQAKRAENPELIRTEVTHSIKALSSCSQAGLNENQKSVESAPVAVVMPITEHPLLPAQNQPENYPDYTDDEQSSDNIAQFEKAAASMKEICFSNAKMLSFTMVPEEDPIVTVQGSLTIVAARIYCHQTAYRTVGTDTVTIEPSTECRNQNISILDVLMCTTHKNAYWYIDNIPLVTAVVYTKFTGNELKRFSMETDLLDKDDLAKEPFKVTLSRQGDVAIQLRIHEAPLPNISISQIEESSFYQTISTHRIFVFKNRGFTVTFQNMTDIKSYDVTVTRFEKPSYMFFKQYHKTISVNNCILDVTETQPYDTFWYLSVLSHRTVDELSIANERMYSFSVSSMGCYLWNDTIRHWEPACTAGGGGSQVEQISCYCKYGHIFTGYIRDNKVNLVENMNVEFALELQVCWVVYITIIGTFFLFSITLCISSFEQSVNILDNVYFVGDVPSFYQYAYIVLVKTGHKRHSGTTSNVTIRLRGSEGDSLAHVLNYPDPELVMLQRNTETWFVLAAEKLLGDIKEIQLWFDSIGNHSKWYCSTIEIFDIQSHTSWLFRIEEWFDVMQRDHNKFIFTPSNVTTQAKSEPVKKSIRVVRAVQSFLGKMENQVNLWNLIVSDPLLTRKEKAGLVFSSAVSMYTIIMLIYSVPNFDESDSIGEYVLGFHHTLLWTPVSGSTVAFLIHFPLVYFIKKGKVPSLKETRIHRFIKITTNAMTLFCWIAVILISTFSITILIICGFWIPLDTSLLWLISVVLGICFNILVLQYISCILYSYCIRLSVQIESVAQIANKIIQYVELQRAWIYKRFGSLALRPYLKHLYFNLDSITIKDRYKWETTKLKVIEILEDLVMITIYVALLYIVLMLEREPQAVYNHAEVKQLVLGKTIGKKMSISSLSNIEDFTEEVLLPSIQAIQWYGKFIQDNPGITKDFSNKYLGIIRLRQHRTKEIKCKLPKMLTVLENAICRPDFRDLKEFGSFSRGWAPVNEISKITTERLASVWEYSGSKITGTPSYFGEYGTYPGGGYVAPLGRNYKNSLINLKYLKKHKWLDRLTRALFVEFLTYNPNVNVFNSVTVIFEINSAGHILTNVKLQTRKFLMVNRDRIFTKEVISSCFAVVIVSLIVRIIYKLIRKRRKYFQDMWSVFDILIVLFSFVSIYLYYARLGHIYGYISQISTAKNNEFVNYFHLFAADNTLTALTAMLVFISTLRLWKLLRFMIIVQITEKTLKDSWAPLLVCLIYQMVSLIAFSTAGLLFFNTLSKDFKDFRTSVTTLLLLGLNLNGAFKANFFDKHPFGFAFYILYMLFSTYFVTVYIAIISLYYADAKDYFADESGFVQKYMQEKWVYYTTLMKVRRKKLRGGEDYGANEDLLIKPRSGERYEDCLAIAKSRLDGMALVTMCVLRNLEEHKTMTKEDFELMSKTIQNLFGKASSEKELFFTSGNSNNIKFVDDRRIRQIAHVCELLVRECSDVPRLSGKLSVIEGRIERINTMVDNMKAIQAIVDQIQINFK